jgi:hypothetical protein
MPKKSNTKKSKPTAAKKKINKSAWIRNQPGTMSASDVVAKAKAEGITVTANQVYTARSTGRSTKSTTSTKPTSGGSVEQTIRRLALTVGIEKVEGVVKKIKAEAGL